MVTRAKWDPAQHPRGPIGRFISVDSPRFQGREVDFESESTWRRVDGDAPSLAEYQRVGDSVNSWIRNGRPTDTPSARSWAAVEKSTDRAVEAYELTEDTTVYRGVSDTFDRARPGDQLHDRAFLSTTTSWHIADGFSFGTVLEIQVPKGARVGATDTWGDEDELVFGRGSVLQVDDVVMDEDDYGRRTRTIRARLVGYLDE